MRRARAAALTLTLAVSLAAPARLADASDPHHIRIVPQQVASGLTSPVFVTSAHDGSSRTFVVEQSGRIRILHYGLKATPFLDISDRVLYSGEQGLLGLAFSPYFKSTGRFFVYFTGKDGNNHVSRYTVKPGGNVASRTEYRIIDISHPGASNHNGGTIAFGPDGYLWIGTGDGGGGGDAAGNAQSRTSRLGKLLRIDVTRTQPGAHYANPTGNIIGSVYSMGLRNPYRWSFDRATNYLWLADVGQEDIEEVDVTPASARGVNYGWDCREGTTNTESRYGDSYCNDGRTFRPPFYQYGHSGARCAIVGGGVYRGSLYKSLMTGNYVFGDSCSGELMMLGKVGTSWRFDVVGQFGSALLGIGTNDSGELFAGTSDGKVWRLAAKAV
jgi:glucose/arabinose dehydrogenase